MILVVDFDVLLIGTDINAYYMARNFHEEYGIEVHILGKIAMNFTCYSTICHVQIEPDLWDNDVFCRRLAEFGEGRGKKTILVGTNDTYVRMIVKNAKFLREWFLFNYVEKPLLDTLLLKEKFYKIYENSNLHIPKTYFYQCKKSGLDLVSVQRLEFPLIVKPSDNVKWQDHEYPGQAKVYKPKTLNELEKIIHDVENAGYDGTLIIQEYIAGDDTYLFDSMFYCSIDGVPRLQSFAQIGLQEHAPTGVGNCTVLINGYNQFDNTDEIVGELKKFLTNIKYTGIAEFDLKYDPNREKFYVLEINPRQARSSYYLTACGHNLAKYLVDDLVHNKNSDFHFMDDEMALSFVPINVIKENIKNEAYVNKVLELKEKKKFTRVLNYKGDKSIKRKLWLLARDLNYGKKYKENSW